MCYLLYGPLEPNTVPKSQWTLYWVKSSSIMMLIINTLLTYQKAI